MAKYGLTTEMAAQYPQALTPISGHLYKA